MEKKKIKKVAAKIEKERIEFKKLFIQNPNYFGTLSELKIKPVKLIKTNTKYEELGCIGFHTERNLIEAVLDVKLSSGYKGDLCSQGSFEYVRFFVDWDGDGFFNDPQDDVGITCVNVHDITEDSKVCLDKTKPISYAVNIKIDTKKRPCTLPHLLKVRAILSWEVPPTEGNPNYIPVWGNVVDRWIQIKPSRLFLKDVVKIADLKGLKLEPEMLDLDLPISKATALSPDKLKEIYKGKDVPEHRFNFMEIKKIAEVIKLDPSLMIKYKQETKFSKITNDIKVVLAQKPNTKYEKLHCVGLNYDLDKLVATVTIKLPYGYNGNLCTGGSHEHVGFWIYVYDQIEQMCSWRYLGTSVVNVHDIAGIPDEGLQYSVSLPVDFSNYWDDCGKPRVLKVRAILSWQTPPPTDDPDYNPVWGNKVDALLQLKPRPKIVPGGQKPFIWSIGNMVVESISGNPHTVLMSTIGIGYANGPSKGEGFNAVESPFGGTIAITGTITNPPDDPAESEKMLYKVQYKKSGETVWHDIADGFRIWIRLNGVPSGYIDQTVDDNGYFKYQKDLTLPIRCEVDDDVLAIWRAGAKEDGLYEIRVLLFKPGAPPVAGIPADHIASSVIRIVVDNTRPEAEISLDAGPCTKFKVGDIFTGKFTATDQHIWRYGIAVEPSVASPPTVDHTGETYPALPAPGRVNEQFKVTTTNTTTPCGYVIHLHVWDRTILNNHMQGNRRGATVGLCLLEKK
jgi:hypothetical protein